MNDAIAQRYPLFSAAEFRRRALNQSGGPVDHAWRDHGDHILNPDIVAGSGGVAASGARDRDSAEAVAATQQQAVSPIHAASAVCNL